MPVTASTTQIQDLMRQWRMVMASSRRPTWGRVDLTLTQIRALSIIGRRQPIRMGELARELGIGLGGASTLVDRMARRSFVTRHADPSDRRIVQLELTSRARRMLDRMERGSAEHLSRLIERMTPAEREGLATALRAFVRLGAEHAPAKDA